MARYLMSVYASGEDGRVTVEDIEKITIDFFNVFREWKLSHPDLTTRDMSIKRFREANLFMPSSDGLHYLEESEITYYIATLFSASALSSKVFNHMVYETKKCGIIGVDELGEPGVAPKCFRENYYGNVDYHWSGFPDLAELYGEMDEYSKERLQYAMEISARKKGYNDDPLGKYDVNSFSAIPHYVEQIMIRFDVNDDGVLDKWELLNGAYPIFREALKDISGKSNDRFLQAVLGYVVKFGKIPKTKMEKAHFVTWRATRPMWKIYARRDALYQVIAVLSSPDTF